MKILHVGPVKKFNGFGREPDSIGGDVSGLGVDGPSRSILGLVTALAGEGLDVGLLSTKRFEIDSCENTSGVRFLTAYTGRKHSPFVRSRQWTDRIRFEFGKPDLVNFHDVYDLFSCGLAAHFRRIGWRYIVTPRGGLRPVAQQRDWVKKWIANAVFFRRYLQGAATIHALSDEEASDVLGFDESLRAQVVPNGIATSFLQVCDDAPISGDLSQGDDLVIGFVGALFVHIKGVDLLLEAIAEVQADETGRRLRFVFVGPIPRADDRRLLKQLVSRVVDPTRISFVGPRHGMEKISALKSFDVVVLPSRTEGMPRVILEAMACGKPCLVSQPTGMAGVVEQHQFGWVCRAESIELAAALRRIAKESRESLVLRGQRARRCVAEHFTWDRVTPAYVEMIQRVLAQVV